jgi:hypothetical protein
MITEIIPHWIGHEKAKAEMYDPVIMVPFQVQHVLQPVAKRVFSIGILCTINMQKEVDKEKGIAKVTEGETVISGAQQNEANYGQSILCIPVSPVWCIDIR